MLLNTEKCQGSNFYRFWVTEGKPAGGEEVKVSPYTPLTCNQFHNIFRRFDVLPNFPFTASETMGDYYIAYKHVTYELPHELWNP